MLFDFSAISAFSCMSCLFYGQFTLNKGEMNSSPASIIHYKVPRQAKLVVLATLLETHTLTVKSNNNGDCAGDCGFYC